MALDHLDKVEIRSLVEWRTWLETHHQQGESIWLVTYKKHHQDYVPWADSVDEALCFGWIDSLPRKLDEDRTMHLMAPRKEGSSWSRVNKEKVTRLIEQNRMHPSGRAKIEAAKADGSWTFLNDVEALIVPDDLVVALSEHQARDQFDAFSPSSKRGILEWIKQAKTPLTRAKRINETATMAVMGLRANHPQDKKKRDAAL